MVALMPRMFGNVDEWLEAEFPMLRSHMIRVEEYQSDDAYVIRAELPGMGPEDVKISVSNGMLSIDAERKEEKQEKHRSEFRYGALHRAATLPANAQEDLIKARYDKGILEITVPLTKTEVPGRAIPIESS